MKVPLPRFFYGLALLLLIPGLAMAQNGTLEGTVTDAETEEPLPGATVQVVGTGIGTATDIEGNFSISLAPGTKEVRASFVGYAGVTREVEIASGETATLDFALSPSTAELDEVVVTGVTSETPKSKLSFTVEQVNAEKLERAPASNPMQALQGKIAGTSIVSSSGQPGSSTSVRLRGTTSLTGDNQPLFIVDGVILGADQVDIGALDVASIEIVKGAAASSLYGSRAQNGVINITTKRGSDAPLGQTRVTVRNEVGFQSLPGEFETNNAHSFAVNNQGQLLNNSGEVVSYSDPVAVAENGPNGTRFRDQLYADLRRPNGDPYTLYSPFDQFFNPGVNYTNYIAVSQNSESTNFRASFTNTREPGVIRGEVAAEGYTRRGFRLNLDHRPAENVSIRASGYYAQSTADDTDIEEVNDPFYSLQFLTPLSNLLERDENGELLIQPDPKAVEENPLYLIENYETARRRARFTGSLSGEYSPFEWASVSASLNYDRSDRDNREFANKGFKSIDPTPENDGEIEKVSIVEDALNYDVTLSLNRDFGDFTGRSQFKYQVEDAEYELVEAQGTNLAASGIPDFANIQSDASKTLNSFNTIVRSEGFYATVEGDYLDRYIADLLIRRDGSSLFGAEERWQTYYRAAGAYRISQESFWPLQNSVNEFKLRYAYGRAGARPEFEAQYETYELDNGQLSKSTLGNNELKPELTTEQEFGVEMSFFDRAYLDVTYVEATVEDLLLEVPLVGPLGFEQQWQNAGTVEYNTIEASLNATAFRTRNMALDVGITFDRTRQKITEFNTNAYLVGPDPDVEIFYYRNNEQVGAMYGAKWVTGRGELETMGLDADYFQVNDDGYMVPVGTGNTWRDGFDKDLWGTNVNVPADTDGDGEMDDQRSLRWGTPFQFVDGEGSDFHQIGNSVPDFNLNFNTTFSYKGLSAYALLSYQDGGSVYNLTRQWAYRDGRHADQDQSGLSDEVKKDDVYYATLYDANGKNSHFVEDATFLKVRELSLGYTFDRTALNNLLGSANVLNRLSLSITGRNLFTFTDYSGIDPEVGDSSSDTGEGDASLFRVDNFNYPQFRTITGRLEFQF